MIKFIACYIKAQIETTIHKVRVLMNIVKIIDRIKPNNKWKLYMRGWKHDLSKYRWSEAKYFAKVIFNLKHLTFGTEEYKKNLEEIKPAVDLHYLRNRHHPEFHKNGFKDMTELDKLELIADWVSAVKRHADGNIFKSIDINQKKFGYDDTTKEWLISIVKIIS